MSARVARTADGWWAVTPAGLVRLDLPAATTAGLLADRPALEAAVEAAQARQQDAVPAESLNLLSPVTTPARVVAQMVNYRSHATDSGFDPDAVPPAFFRKASHSITGPTGDIIRPEGVGFLDYEAELGLVIGAGRTIMSAAVLPWRTCPFTVRVSRSDDSRARSAASTRVSHGPTGVKVGYDFAS